MSEQEKPGPTAQEQQVAPSEAQPIAAGETPDLGDALLDLPPVEVTIPAKEGARSQKIKYHGLEGVTVTKVEE